MMESADYAERALMRIASNSGKKPKHSNLVTTWPTPLYR
jgi:hypothetical protein